MRSTHSNGKGVESLSFVETKVNGRSFYPKICNKGYQHGESIGKDNAVELFDFYQQNGFEKEVLSRMLVSLVGLDPVNDELTPKEETMIGHIKGISSVAHYYIAKGILASSQN